MIEVQEVSKIFRLNKKQQKEFNIDNPTFAALDKISFVCKPGSVFSLLGPNGAGKTTMLRIIATILNPDTGGVLINNKNTKEHKNLIRKEIGFLTGSTNLYEKLTASEIVKYFSDLYQIPNSVFLERKKNLFDQLQINEFANKKIGELSTGMKQKVSIARSMIHNPSIVIFDEPTSGLDVITAHSIIELIKQCKQENKTIIFSSHIMSEVELLCDELAIIAHGKLIYNDTFENYKKELQGNSLTENFINRVMLTKSA